jgi:hypothetical protein
MKRLASALVVLTLSACATASPQPAAEVPQAPAHGVALVEIDGGLVAVDLGPGAEQGERWRRAGAVAAPDGSAVFAAPDVVDRQVKPVMRLDPRTGEVRGSWTVDAAARLDAVAPDGRWVALTARSAEADMTVLTVLEPATGNTRTHRLWGDIRAEAFSVDGEHLFAIRRFGDHYRVVLLGVFAGGQAQTLSRDKVEGGDMTGGAVAAVLSPDRTVLATLYRNPPDVAGHPGHEGSSPAFVHLADLENTWTSCIDLPAPFGTGPAGDDVIVADGRDVVVAATASGAVARIDASAVHTPALPTAPNPIGLTVTRGGPVPRWPAAATGVEGFERMVAVLPD